MERPQVPQEEFNKPVGSNMPERKPLELLPDREWIYATIKEVRFQYSIFNNKIQYYTDMNTEEQILDENGNPIPRREFEITFHLKDYLLPNNDPRKAWLRMSASKGEGAHLPVFLFNMGIQNASTPNDIINALKEVDVKLQVQNKPSKTDVTKVYQNVIFDAVKPVNAPATVEEPEPFQEQDVTGDPDADAPF